MQLDVAIIGAGPAGLMAAEAVIAAGRKPVIFDAMPSPGRKFLMAGKSGLNITHTDPEAIFLSRYSSGAPVLREAVRQFGPEDIRAWMAGLGATSFEGSSGRVFPVGMKASPLLRAWLKRLEQGGARLLTRQRWTGWDETGALVFETPEGGKQVRARSTVFACGGASWAKLGSDGAWKNLFDAAGLATEPFAPSNMGVLIDWPDELVRLAGAPVKPVQISVGIGPARMTSRGECVVTQTGLEGGAIYALSAALREAHRATGGAALELDLAPDLEAPALAKRFARLDPKLSLANRLRKAARLDGARLALARRYLKRDIIHTTETLAAAIKALSLPVRGFAPMDRAISTAGGVGWEALDDQLMLIGRPGCFVAGEMIAWDAPTGGYLLTACLSTGRLAGRAAADYARQT